MVFVCLDSTIGYCPDDVTFHSNFNLSWSEAPPGMKSYQTCSLPRTGKHAHCKLQRIRDCKYNLVDCWRLNGKINIHFSNVTTGNASRTCFDNGIWGLPDLENCLLSEISDAKTQVSNSSCQLNQNA